MVDLVCKLIPFLSDPWKNLINKTILPDVFLRFMDVWGKQKVGNPNFREGVEPHIWADGGKTDWYVFHPSKADYQKLAAGVERYLSVFQDMEMTQSPSYGSQQISP